MVPENKQNRRYKQINFIGLQNNCHPSQHTVGNKVHRHQLAPADFFLFPCLKSIMKRARFADVAAIQERVTAVLRSIPKEAFFDSFQKIYERCQQYVVKDGNYFEGE
jgi:methylmalonyl-CoA mutase cobalamin-binding subunit